MKILKIFLFLLLFLKVNLTSSQWHVINSGVTNNLVDGCFINDSTGFIVSSNGIILRTLDNGNTWNTIAVLDGFFTSICNAGTDTIYAGGDCIYRSNDRGNSWSLITNLSFTITDLGFFGSKSGFATVPGYYYCTWIDGKHTFENYHVYKSTDFGFTWQSIFGNIEETSRFQFINDSTAFITGSGVDIVAHCAGPWFNASKRTNDRGITWFTVSQPMDGNSYFSFIDENTGYFIQPWNVYNIYKTVDGGNTLSESYTEIYDNTVRQCKFINEIDGYLLGQNNIYVTSSNGLCWNDDYSVTDTLNFLFNNQANFLYCIGTNGLILKKEIITSAYTDTIYRITPDNNSISFGFVYVNSTLTKPLTIKNTGNISLNISITSSDNFKISFTDSTFVNNLNIALNPFQSTKIYIQFNPLQVRNYCDTLLITADNLNTVKIPLHGDGFYGLTGNIYKDTLLCTDTLRIGGDITIKDSAKATICAGTKVLFLGNYKITVEGTLEALGDSINNIRFIVSDTNALWNGIYINNSNSSDTSVFNYCNITAACNSPLLYIYRGIANIDHCDFSNGKSGMGAIEVVDFRDQCRLIIENSRIYNTKGSAILLEYCDSAFIINNEIYNNYRGIAGSKRLFIIGNNIYNNTEAGIEAGSKLIIQNNKIYNNGGGIRFYEGRGVQIENNEIYNNGPFLCGGVDGGVADGGAYIIQNLVFNNSSYQEGAGIALAPTRGFDLPAYIVNNTICNNKSFIIEKGNNFYATTNTSSGLDIKLFNNIIFDINDAGSNIAWFPRVTHEIKFNCINQDSINIWGQNNIDNNPRFVKPTDSIGIMANIGTYDWSLKESSLCINAGDSINTSFLLPVDIAGNPRIYNYRVDIGAFEYQGMYIPDNDTTNSVVIFPNPASSMLNINVNSNTLVEIRLYDITSKLIIRKQFTEFVSLDIRNFSKGLYLYEIRDKQGLIKKGKIVKE